jgi:hypothetical protein
MPGEIIHELVYENPKAKAEAPTKPGWAGWDLQLQIARLPKHP